LDYKDYYKTLGVPKTADADEIKKAFRKLARQHHPDVNKGDKKSEEKFKEINEAYEVLGDADKRKVYDKLGTNYNAYQRGGGNPQDFNWAEWAAQAGQAGQRTRSTRQQTNFDPQGEAFDFSDFFSTLFGGGGGFGNAGMGGMGGMGGQPTRQNLDQEHDVEITLREAYHGTKRILNKDGRTYEVNIPAGVKTGSKVRVRGQGAKTAQGEAGDLYLTVKVMEMTPYERKDDDLYRDVDVNVFAALIGGEVNVETLAGEMAVKIPAGTSSGKLVRLRGKGMPKLGAKDEHGDLYLRVNILVPKHISEEDRWTLEQIGKRYAGK